MFLSDLESYLQSKDVGGLTTLSDEIENQLNVYLKIFVNFRFFDINFKLSKLTIFRKDIKLFFEDPLWFPTLSLYRRRTV
jgi:hypothetical protein